LMQKIKVIADEAIEALLPKVRLRVVATTKDRARHEVQVENPLGHPDNPMQDHHIEEKFLALATPVLGGERSRAALESWWQVADAPDVSTLIKKLDLQPAPRAR